MAIVTSTPKNGEDVDVYDIPDDVLQKYGISGEKAAQMFPEGDKPSAGGIPQSAGAMAVSRVANAEGLGEVQAYSAICICRQLYCNWRRCWWHYYYCYC